MDKQRQFKKSSHVGWRNFLSHNPISRRRIFSSHDKPKKIKAHLSSDDKPKNIKPYQWRPINKVGEATRTKIQWLYIGKVLPFLVMIMSLKFSSSFDFNPDISPTLCPKWNLPELSRNKPLGIFCRSSSHRGILRKKIHGICSLLISAAIFLGSSHRGTLNKKKSMEYVHC